MRLERKTSGGEPPWKRARGVPTSEPAESAKLKICLAEDEGMGKTSLVRRFVLSEFDDRYLRTVGVVVHKRVVMLGPIDGRSYSASLTVWDVLGGPAFARLAEVVVRAGLPTQEPPAAESVQGPFRRLAE